MCINQGHNLTRSRIQNRTIIQIILVHVKGDEIQKKFYAIEFYVLVGRFQDAAHYQGQGFVGVVLLEFLRDARVAGKFLEYLHVGSFDLLQSISIGILLLAKLVDLRRNSIKDPQQPKQQVQIDLPREQILKKCTITHMPQYPNIPNTFPRINRFISSLNLKHQLFNIFMYIFYDIRIILL